MYVQYIELYFYALKATKVQYTLWGPSMSTPNFMSTHSKVGDLLVKVKTLNCIMAK